MKNSHWIKLNVTILICLSLIMSQSSVMNHLARHRKHALSVTRNSAFRKYLLEHSSNEKKMSNSFKESNSDRFKTDSTQNSLYSLQPEQTISEMHKSDTSFVNNESLNIAVTSLKAQHPLVSYDHYFDFTQNDTVHAIFVLLYTLVMLTAVLGNVLVCHTVLSNRKMQTVVNCYILNLALCDLLVGVFVLPSKAIEFLIPPHWFSLNEFLCSTFYFLQTLVVFASVLTLVATCFERYFAIVHPLKSRMQQSKRRTSCILVLVWSVSALGSAPYFIMPASLSVTKFSSEYGNVERSTCLDNFDDTFRKIYYTALFVLFYLLPLCLIAFTSFCIAKSLLSTSVLRRQGSLLRQEINRRKYLGTPYFVVTIITQYQKENFMHKHDYLFTMLSINLFAFLHSSINPFIYATMSTRFRQSFAASIRSIVFCGSMSPSVATDLINDQASSKLSLPHNGPRTETCASSSSQTAKMNVSECLPMLPVRQPETVE